MTRRTLSWVGGCLLNGLVLFIHGHLPTSVNAQEPAPSKAAPLVWAFDEARNRLTLSPRDAYLQYVVLQLGRRDGREEEAIKAVEGRSPLAGLGLGGRGRQADLFATFTGALAIQESLQLDTMRGERAGGRPPVGPMGLEKSDVSKLVGPVQPSHPWEKMLGAKKPDVGVLAGLVPEEYYFAEFRSVARLHEVLGAGELWSGHIFTQALGGARSQQTADRIRTQLGLSALPPAVLDKLGVEAVGVTGSDPFLAEGSDITLLAVGRTVGNLAALADDVKGGKVTRAEHVGVAYIHRTNSDGVSVYSASPRQDLHVRGNSLPAFKHVLETVVGKTLDGKPVKRLGDSAEFRYVRTRMVREPEEDGFVYLSDAFIRNLTGPRLKITERRRVIAYNHLRMIGHAALLFRTQFGRAPKSLDELAEKKCAPGVFGKGDLAHPDGGTYTLAADGMTGVCSRYGRIESMTPCVERLVSEVSGTEAADYNRFVAEYSQYWRQFFDPIAVRVTVTPKQYKLETLVLPLIDNSIYTELARNAGKPVAMDLLPTPKREVGGVWLALPKDAMLSAVGPDRPPIVISPLAKIRNAAERTSAANNLKQVGLAFTNFEAANGWFPDDIRDKAGKPLLSWRVAILPFVEQDELYKQFKLDEPWDSEHNKKLIPKMPKFYTGRSAAAVGKTGFLRPTGKGTAFVPGQKLKIANITDGTSNTVAVVESITAVEWTKPADLSLDPKQPLEGLPRKPGALFLSLFFDGSVQALGPTVTPVMWLRALDPADGQLVDFEEPLPPEVSRPKLPVQVQNDLKQLGLAIHSYQDANRRLPTTNIRDKAGKPLLSWRVAILPFVEQDELFRQFKLDEPWDSEQNKKLIPKMPKLYAGPLAKLTAAGKTPYVLPSGKNTLSPVDDARLTLAGIHDGMANTILATVADAEHSVIWTRPEDLPFDPKHPLKGLLPPGQEWIDVLMADGSVRRFTPRIAPAKFAAMVTPTGGETVSVDASEELTPQQSDRPGLGLGIGQLLPGIRIAPEDLANAGIDPAKLRRFLRDGIGDQVGVHIHDAPRLLDADLSGLFGGGESAGLTGVGLVIRFLFGPTSVSFPVKDTKVVDEFLAELDKSFLSNRQEFGRLGIAWRRDVDFYKVAFPEPHTIRCASANFAGLKWRVYWGRIGNGLYFATRPFILEDIAAVQAAGKRPAKSEPAHALLRVRPENWKDVLPGYNLGWAEANRSACHSNLEMLANTSRGWNDRGLVAGAPTAELSKRVMAVFGERPYCPEGGRYELTPTNRSCRCTIHGGHDDPKQPAAPTAASATGRLVKTFDGLTAAIRFEADGLRVTVTVDRK